MNLYSGISKEALHALGLNEYSLVTFIALMFFLSEALAIAAYLFN